MQKQEPFIPSKPVSWFNPTLLFQTGIRAVISSIFGSFADKRETEASIDHDGLPFHDYSNLGDCWVDYVADTGDGFDPTYTVAKAASLPVINLGEYTIPRGDLLILGGDEVYPTASREEYKQRFRKPYELAFPYTGLDDSKMPTMFAIPGNHDWYDGLTSFLKQFCQKRYIANWKTVQTRSYFAIKLPQDVWIWGTDIQLEEDIDAQQLAYFKRVKEHMPDGGRVILCTAEPSWVGTSKHKDNAFHNLKFFEEQIIKDNSRDIKLLLVLAGDLHHYTRYSCNSGPTKHRITAGGGGAFMHPTHNLPENLKTSDLDDQCYSLKKTFPKSLDSKKMGLKNWAFPYYNKAFTVFLGAYFLFMLALLHSWVLFIHKVNFKALDIIPVFDFGVWVLSNPFLIGLNLLLFYCVFKFTDTNPINARHKDWIYSSVGILHGIVQVGIFYVLYQNLMLFSYHSISLFISTTWRNEFVHYLFPFAELFTVVLLSGLMFLFGGLLSSHIFGFYLMFSNWFLGMHDNEAYSALSHSGYKNFLRINISETVITIYPIGIKKCPKWRVDGNDVSSISEIEPELIEPPIVILLEKRIIINE